MDGGIFMGKIAFLIQALVKSYSNYTVWYSECQPTCVDGGDLDMEDENLKRQVLGKSCPQYADLQGQETLFADFTV